jgi:hypothetical protein
MKTVASGKGDGYVLTGYLMAYKGHDGWSFTKKLPEHIHGSIKYKPVYERLSPN